MTDVELRDAMIDYRARERITQTELAARCGISTQTLNYIERGKQTPLKTTRKRIELVVGKEE